MIRVHIHDRTGHRVLDAEQPRDSETGQFVAVGNKKGRVGKYEYWHVGPQHWEVRKEGQTLSRHRQMNEASTAAERAYNREKSGATRDQGAQGSQGTTGTAFGGAPRRAPRPEKPPGMKAGGFTVDQPPVQRTPQPGMSHEQAAQQHEAAAQHHVGLNYGQQNPVSRAHTEAAKAHKTAHSLFGKPGYQQAANWAMSASQHAGRMAKPQQQDQTPPPPQSRPQPTAATPLPPSRPQPTATDQRAIQRKRLRGEGHDYGTAEGAAKRQQGGSGNPAEAHRKAHAFHKAQAIAGKPEHQLAAALHQHAQATHASPNQMMRERYGAAASEKAWNASRALGYHDAAASPRAPGTPKPPGPPPPPKPPSPKPPASAAPPKPQQPPKPKGPPAPPKPVARSKTPFGARVAGAAHAPLHLATRAVEGVKSGAEEIGAWQRLLTGDTGTKLGAKRAISTKRHLQAEDEAKKRRSWFGPVAQGHRSIDAWFYRDFDESKVKRDEGGRFSETGGGGAKSETQSASGGAKGKPAIKGDMSRQPQADTQDIKDIEELYDKAKKDEKGFVDAIKGVADVAGGEAIFTPPEYAEPGTTLKKRESAERKLKDEDIAGDPAKLRDILRATIMTENSEGVRSAAAAFIDKYGPNIVKVKDRMVKPAPGGYRDILINFRTPSGLISEVQFNSPRMIETKQGEGHRIYEKIRELEAADKVFHEDEIRSLKRRSEEVYATAYKADGNGNWA
jgi:hypothetical protein